MTRDETQKSSSKPTLDAEGFQRLLTAAYILQSRSETAAWPIGVPDTDAFSSTAIHQKRTLSIRTLSIQSSRMKEANIAPRRAGPIFWKQVEAFGIAGVFCLMMGMSIHRALASSGRASQLPRMLETRDAGPLPSSTPKVLTSSQQNAAAQESIGYDLVVHYRVPTAATRTTSTSGARIAISRKTDLAANRVVQYGDDVTMWSSGESSLGQLSSAQSRKVILNR
jgi:hypothetical protein